MNSRQTKTFIGAIVLAAIASITYAAMHSHTLNPFYAPAVLALAAATSRMKVKLPGIEGNMSVNLPFLLMAVMTLSAVEAVLIACLSTVVQCWPKSNGKFRPEQMLFNVSMMGCLGKSKLGVSAADAGCDHRYLLPRTDSSGGSHH
jgi:hypothetical protein